ncbi:peptidoglycan DD-metalloendopeptidase family protein [Salinimonas marina]|uniref:Peptidoglycan DD-metalloendopeptidase family protein n=1 Tax=Salinimonas marina TaxID=2785918 RepID=A0A7S9DY22_9ALTE|nr:peptidoglycan DD-metalloendopeptidase family protein [Salinimonas marina]QPG05395.1 peptidoglycan DD-metalloendopeptidase family protein [Salinimonas marina]
MMSRSGWGVVGSWLLLLSAGFFIVGDVSAQQQEQARLEELRAQLKSRQQTLKANQANAEELQAFLAESEKEIGRAAAALNQTQQSLAHNREQQQQLENEQQTLKQAIVDQQDLLASQLRSAFMAGHYDYAKMIFYQEEAKSFERVLMYYKYVSKARQREITRFKKNVARLEAVTRELQDKASELQQLLQQQQGQKAELLARQQDREQTLQKLNQKIASDAARVKEMEASEKALIAAIEAARRAAERAKTKLAGLQKQKGKLTVPAQGKVRRLFGSRRQGQVRWKGVVIEASEGSAVKAISHGRVLYADWLKGFGLVTIVDHGKGFMSVYGHNQALLKQAGDKVGNGESIALVGQSGGQSYPNLYFEIRHKGKALNPASWLDL